MIEQLVVAWTLITRDRVLVENIATRAACLETAKWYKESIGYSSPFCVPVYIVATKTKIDVRVEKEGS